MRPQDNVPAAALAAAVAAPLALSGVSPRCFLSSRPCPLALGVSGKRSHQAAKLAALAAPMATEDANPPQPAGG